MNSQYRMSMMAAAIAAAFAPTVYAQSAGKVDFATPGVNAVGADGRSRPLAKGAEIAPGEIIDTGAGRAQLRFTDGGFVSLAPQTQFRLESYGYDKDDSSKNSIVMNMLKGGLRTVTGLIGKTNRQGYRLQTATATVGIRGTEFAITGFPDGSILFHVTDGAIDVTNRAGSSTINGGQAALVTSQDNIPRTTNDVPYLPPTSFNNPPVLPNTVAQASSTIAPTGHASTPILAGNFFGQWRTATDMTGPNRDAYNWMGGSFGYGSNYGAYAGDNNQNNCDTYGCGQSVNSPRTPSFTVSSNGNLIGYSNGYGTATTTGNFTHAIGSAGSILDGNDGIMAWGRWVGGPTTVNGGAMEGQTYTLADPLHWVVGQPVSLLPTAGSATYNMYSGTAPTCSGASCGGAISVGGQLNVNFGLLNGNFNMIFANTKDGANFGTSGALSFDSSGVNFVGSGPQSSGNVNYAYTTTSGFLAGPKASNAGSVYQTNYTIGNATTIITGAAVFKRGDIGTGTFSVPNTQ